MTREQYLDMARQCICGDRQADYGDARDNFTAIADAWSWYTEEEYSATDVAIMMALLKIARLKTGQPKDDSFVDAIGYLALAGELVERDYP